MATQHDRRQFLQKLAIGTAGLPLVSSLAGTALAAEPLYKISLAEWSLHKGLKAGELDNLDFAKIAHDEFGIHAIEYVNQFFKDKAQRSEAYLDRSQAASGGSRSQEPADHD